MAGKHANDRVFERLVRALEEAVELCAGAHRDRQVMAIRKRCALASKLAAELHPPA